MEMTARVKAENDQKPALNPTTQNPKASHHIFHQTASRPSEENP
jgi:hypothetical protein